MSLFTENLHHKWESTPGPNPNVSESLKRQIREEGEAQRRTDGRCFKMKENRPKLIKSQENMRAKEKGRERALSNPSYPKGVLQNRERGRKMTAAKKSKTSFLSLDLLVDLANFRAGAKIVANGISPLTGMWRKIAAVAPSIFLGQNTSGKRPQSLSGFK